MVSEKQGSYNLKSRMILDFNCFSWGIIPWMQMFWFVVNPKLQESLSFLMLALPND